MTDAPSKRLLEELIPLAEIGVEASKSISYGDIHAIHTWFARRPLAACRAATFAALVDAPKTEAERDELQALMKRAIPNKSPVDDPEAIAEMRRLIRETFKDETPRVLDPFAGGGSLPLEAARLGCEAHALDLNPVACLTLLGTVDYPLRLAEARIPLPPTAEESLGLEAEGERTGNLVQAVEAWGQWVLERAMMELAPHYPPEPDGSPVVAYFWAKTVRCTNPACGAEIPLVAHRWLSRREGKEPVAYRMIPQPDRTLWVEILQGEAARRDQPDQGTMARGSTKCPHCPQTLSPDEVKAQANDRGLGRMMLAVAYKSPDENGTSFRAPNRDDLAVFAKAQQALRVLENHHDDPFLPIVPDEPFPEVGALGMRPCLYGVRTWGQMHNPRQALALATLARLVGDAHRELRARGARPEAAEAVALYLAFAQSRMVGRLSEASRWDNSRDNVQSATGGHRIAMVWDYAEANPIGGGSGSWQSTVGWSLPSIERILGAGSAPANVRWGDATKLPYDDDSFDAVLTDPPYYDSVPYGYLSDMQYVWLHRALKDVFPESFPAPLTPKSAEIIQDRARHGSDAEAKAAFEQGLRAALGEARRVLKPGGIALVMYAHTATSAWETMVSALIGAGFQVTASWPVNTETTSRRDWLGGVVLAATIFLVCRKRQGNRVGYLDEVLPEMREEVRRALARFWAAGIGGADFFVSAIGPALSVYSRYGEVRYTSGQVISVASFLALVRQAVVDFSLQRALGDGEIIGQVDRETQFALLWTWTYGRQKVETGAALLLDKATGVELAELQRQGLLAKANGSQKMVLQGPKERSDVVENTLRLVKAGRSATIIDVVHAAARLWQEGRREELAELLETQGETTRRVAQALADLHSDGSAERQMINGFLGAWRHTSAGPEAVKGEQLPLEL